MSDLSIPKKLSLSFAVLVVAAAAMGTAVFISVEHIDTVGTDRQQHNEAGLKALTARAAVTKQENSLRGYIITRDTFFSDRVKQHYETFEAALDGVEALVSDAPGDAQMLQTARTAMAAWQSQIADPVIALVAAGRVEDAVTEFTSGKADTFIEPVEETVDALFTGTETAIAAANSSAATAITATKIAVGVGIAALIAFSLGLAWLLSRSVSRPISSIAGSMQRLARNDLSIELPEAVRKDEIGQMAKSVEVFRQAAIERGRLESEATSARNTAETLQTKDAERERVKADELRDFVDQIEVGFAQLADGDLTVRLDQPLTPAYEQIRLAFNESMAKLESTIGHVVTAIGSIRTGLGEINTASHDLAERTEQQAASLEQTVAALSQVSSAVGQTAEGAGRAQKTANSARVKAEQGGEVVSRAVTAMSQIEGSSQKINQIISVIDEIAFQTNLLALNAGVEAARAGEAGRGFAVVAQEVRGLAQRSADAAKEIKDLIATSRTQVEAGVELVTASGKSLDAILAEVGAMTEVITVIAESAREQSISLREVSTAADQMEKVTQQNAAMVEEATAASQTLTSETNELAHAISQFKTSMSIVQKAPHQAAAARSQARYAPAGGSAAGRDHHPSAERKSARSPVVQMKTVGSAALAPQVDSWEEF